MALIFEEFKNIVPKETYDFFNNLLPQLDEYIYLENDLEIGEEGEFIVEGENDIAFYLSFYCLSNFKEYSGLLSSLGFKSDNYDLNDRLEKADEETFNRYSHFLPIYEDISLYQGLHPLDIVMEILSQYESGFNHRDFSVIFSKMSLGVLKEKLKKTLKIKKQEQETKIENQIYDQVPIPVIEYLENASRIRAILMKKLKYDVNQISDLCKIIDDDLVPLSLLIALYFDGDNNQAKNYNTEQGAIVCLLEEKGIMLHKILSKLSVEIIAHDISITPKNIYAIKDLYKKYYAVTQTNSINITDNLPSILGIFKKILNRKFTNSLVIEKILSKFDCNMDMFKNVEEEIIRAVEIQKKNIEQEKIKSFYRETPKKTRDFIEFANKTYNLLLNKMIENKHNDKILSTENDALVLSIYIANYYFNGQINEFFSDNGVVFYKVLNLLNIDLKKQEIEKIQVDRNVLVDKYNRFVYQGENTNKSTSAITINDVCRNLCNKEFTNSMILQNIFNSISTEVELKNEFLQQMNKHFEAKQKRINFEKNQKFFHDMRKDTIDILENASRIYPNVIKSNQNLDKRTAQSISILCSILNSNDKEANDFVKSLGFYDVTRYLNISSSFSGNVDINLLIDEFGLLTFGLVNKNKKREELKPIDLLRNIFTKEFNNSIAMTKFLANYDMSYETFENFDLLYEQYLDKKRTEEKEDKVNISLNVYRNEIITFIKKMSIIYKLIIDEKENLNEKLISNEDDIDTLVFMITVFTTGSSGRDFFIKNGLTLEKIANVFGFNKDILKNSNSGTADFDVIEKYKKYLNLNQNNKGIVVDELIKNIFSEKDFVKKIIELTNCDYKIISKEIETGKDYENSLTINDRIAILDSQEIEVLDQTRMESILSFGTSLSPHSQYIHDNLTNMLENDKNDLSISTIISYIEKMYIEEETVEKQPKLISRIFSSSDNQTTILTLNKSIMRDLKHYINVMISSLKNELLQYDSIRRYIELISKRNRHYHEISEQTLIEVNETVTKLDPNNDEDYSNYLGACSLSQILNDKVNRFSTANLLMKKELLRVNQSIINHFITINSLEMARDDLIPLIESEIAIAKGNDTENKAIELSKNIIGLFQALLTRNIDDAIDNMNRLQRTSIPQELITSINNDVNTHIQGIAQVKTLESKIENYESKGGKKVFEKTPTKPKK